MIKAVLFDLDDTLVSLNLTAFVARYTAGVADVLAQAARLPMPYVAWAMGRSLLSVDGQERKDDLTNEELFAQEMLARTDIPLDDPVVADLVDCFEREVVPEYGRGVVRARPVAGARAAVDAVGEAGLVCALATNPTFSLATDEARLGWAGLSARDFALVSTLSNSRRTKPCARYYQEFANQLGVTLDECLMVGNDSRRDFPHPDCGLRTAYVGHARPKRAMWRGSMAELARALPALVERLDAERG